MIHRGRRRRGRRGRPPLPVYIGRQPSAREFTPTPHEGGEAVRIEAAELEALRLVDLEDLSQEEAGQRMGVSRGTVWRLLQSARKKVISAIVQGRRLEISQPENV